MKIENGFWFCECGLRAEHKASIGWRCPEHGVAGYKIPKVIGCLVCGFRTDKEQEIKEFQLNGCKCATGEILIGDTVKTKALNGEIFIGKVIGLDRFGFADVSFNNISESRILVTQLEKGE